MKTVLISIALFQLFTITSCNSPSNESGIKPNIVFVLADDLGYSQLGCNGSNYYQTPNIDNLAKNGMRFTNAYAACPVCSPTRASIMTGKYPARLHLTDFIAGNKKDKYLLSQPDWQKHLPLEETTFAEILKEDGYRTAIFGKWHLSKNTAPPESLPFNPDKQGFDESFVTYKPAKNRAQYWQDAEIDAHNVDTITSLSLDFIERNQDSPFFLFVSHNTIHDPLKEKAETIQKYEELEASSEAENHPIIAAMIERLDNSCGKIFNKLTELGLDENTIVIFFADNGGVDQYAKQTPFRAGKGMIYEGGIREPLIVKWKGKVTPGSTSNAMVSSIDFLPTFLEMTANSFVPDSVDGLSFMPTLMNPEIENHTNLFWHYPHYHTRSGMVPAGAVRSGDFKLIKWYEPQYLKKEGTYELYNLKEDVGELNNLANEFPEKVAALDLLFEKWKTKVNAQEPTINTNYKKK